MISEFDYVKSIIITNDSLVGDVMPRIRAIELNIPEEKTVFQFEKKEFNLLYNLIKSAISTRPDKTKRVERWECFDRDGIICEKKKKALLKAREKNKSATEGYINERALLNLLDNSTVDFTGFSRGYRINMAKIYLSEIKTMSNKMLETSWNQTLKKRVELLGL